MQFAKLIAAAALALTAAACSDTVAGNELAIEANVAEDPAIDAVLGANADNRATAMLPRDAAGFANALAASDLYEVRSGALAMEKSPSENIRSIAQMLRREHQQSAAELKSAAEQAGVTVEPALDPEKQAMIAELEAASGADFDRKYLGQQRTAHQKTLMLLQNYAQAADNEALEAYAAKSQKMVERHLDELNATPM